MDRPTDELLQRMLAAVVGAFGTDERVDRLVESARAEAEAEVKELLKTAVKATLLQRAVARLEASPPADAPAPEEVSTLVPPAATSEQDDPPDGPTGCYVYGITRAGAAVPADAQNVAGRTGFAVVRHVEVQAVTSDVSLADFGPDGIAERVKDLEWVEAKVRAHDWVVKALTAGGAVIPCRFCTILRDEDDVRRVLALHHDRIAETLDALDARKEWGVKIHAHGTADGADAGPAAEDPAPGKAYFLQRKHADRARGEAARAAREAAEACHEALSAAACAATLLKAQDRAAPGGRRSDQKLVLNGAYLVADADQERFHGLVEELARRHERLGLSFEITGPWPPYNFVSLDLSLQPREEPEAAA